MKLSKSLSDKLTDYQKSIIAPLMEKMDKVLIKDGLNPDEYFLDDETTNEDA